VTDAVGYLLARKVSNESFQAISRHKASELEEEEEDDPRVGGPFFLSQNYSDIPHDIQWWSGQKMSIHN
jgi:hypothetical protein